MIIYSIKTTSGNPMYCGILREQETNKATLATGRTFMEVISKLLNQ